LAASRLAWGNSRVTTTLLLQVGQSANTTTGPRGVQACCAMFENCLAWQRLTCALARGAHYIRRPPTLQQKNLPEMTIFPGVFYVFVARARSIRRTSRHELNMLQTLSVRAAVILSAMVLTSMTSLAAGNDSKSRAGEREFR